MKKPVVYGVCTLSLLLLIAAACFLPQLVFQIEDAYRMGRTWSEERTGLAVENLNMDYEMSVDKRLESFAENVDSFFVSGTELLTDQESYMVTGAALEQDIIWILQDFGVLPAYFSYDIIQMKRYLICHEDLNKGIALSTYYCELQISDGFQVKVLFDEKTNTIYCLRFELTQEAKDAYGMESDLSVAHTNNYDLGYIFAYYYGIDPENGLETILEDFGAGEDGELDFFSVKILLPYDFTSLSLCIGGKEEKEGLTSISFEIKEIAELIPELAESGS